MKPAYRGTEVILHQDQALWSQGYPRSVNVWLALSKVRTENGGLVGFPGAGRQGLIPHYRQPGSCFHEGIDWRASDLEEPQPVDLDPGDLACWDRFFVHGSGRNQSKHPRRGIVFVFIGTECANPVPAIEPTSESKSRRFAAVSSHTDSFGCPAPSITK